MAAIGSSWAAGSWATPAWAAGTWANRVAGAAATADMDVVRLLVPRVPRRQPIFPELPGTVEGALSVTFAPLALEFHARGVITDAPPAVIEGTLDLACELPELSVTACGVVLDDEAAVLRVIAAALAEAGLL